MATITKQYTMKEYITNELDGDYLDNAEIIETQEIEIDE